MLRKVIAAHPARGLADMKKMVEQRGWVAVLALAVTACGSGVSSLGGKDAADASSGGSGGTNDGGHVEEARGGAAGDIGTGGGAGQGPKDGSVPSGIEPLQRYCESPR